MKTLISALVLFALCFTNTAIAQSGKRMNANTQNYNAGTETTINGTVVKVEKMAYGKRNYYGIHLVVKTASGKMPVHLGPQWYIDEQKMSFDEGDAVEVTGSAVVMDGEKVIIAKTVKKGKELLKLRNDDGTPVWSGQRRR